MIESKGTDGVHEAISNLEQSFAYFEDLMNLVDMDIYNMRDELKRLRMMLRFRLAKAQDSRD